MLFPVLVLVPDHQCVENFYLAGIHAQWVDLDGVQRERFGQPGDSSTHVCHRTASVFQSLWPSAGKREQSEDHAFRYHRDMLIVIGNVEARPDTIDRILELGLAHVQRSRLEPGCIQHSIHRDVENELRVVFIEQWEDAKALEDHFLVPASGEFVREAAALAVRPPKMSIFEAEVVLMGNPAPEKRRS